MDLVKKLDLEISRNLKLLEEFRQKDDRYIGFWLIQSDIHFAQEAIKHNNITEMSAAYEALKLNRSWLLRG